MDKILQDLQQLLDRARNLIREYEGKLQTLKDEKKALDELRTNHDFNVHSLNERELAVKHIENVVELHTNAQQMHQDAQGRLITALEAERWLKTLTDEETQKLVNLREITNREAKAVDVQRKSIEDEVSKRVQQVLKNMGVNATA